jgi:RNA polymerase sigma-70 factor (ECF subfamily)
MYVDDDRKEINVSPNAADMLLASDTIGSVSSVMPEKAVAESNAIDDLGVLFREHYRPIFRIAYRITGSQSDAEDVLQTIFLRLTTKSSSLTAPSSNPQGYLYRSAVNASLDLLRHRKRANAVSLDVLEFDQGPKHLAGTPEDRLVDTELRELIRHAVAKLEGRASAAFALRYFEGYDNGQIAEILGTSQLVVAVTLHRARTRLRKEIGNYLEKHNEAK